MPQRKIKKEYAAGGVVYKDTDSGPKIAVMLDPYYKWSFPKGHIEKGETAEEAALAEAQEELGVSELEVMRHLGRTNIKFIERWRHGKPVPEPRAMIHKTIEYFLLRAPKWAKARPENEELIRAVKWMSPEEAQNKIKYKNLVPILDQAIKYIYESHLPPKRGGRGNEGGNQGSGSRTRR